MRVRRFNSATARSPWRLRRPEHPVQTLDRFNSATARSPWRPVVGCHSYMGCHSFNSATARSPWRPRGRRPTRLNSPPLQFGHGSVAVETPVSPERRVGGRVASIRPRLGRRGDGGASRGKFPGGSGFNSATARSPWRRVPVVRGVRAVGHASIRPRLGRRGDRSPRSGRRRRWRRFNSATARSPWRRSRSGCYERTFGRFNSATARSPWRPRTPVFPLDGSRPTLQFGHGSVAVETPTPPIPGIFSPFRLQFGHGSVAVETLKVTLWAALAAALQFGHGSVAVETSRGTRRRSRSITSFNSATARSPWRPRTRPRTRTRRCPGFNSATARSPWRQRRRADPGRGGRASIRPRLGRRGDGHAHPVAHPEAGASIRPRLDRRGDTTGTARTATSPGRFNSATARSPWRQSARRSS